ncbi:MAG: NAD(P)/FAD-dependent oxidoreductase [Clostridia bacterium]|nr:NAD(P)/FAD-dependent oxidoreductase [Clostridia bacterium]
MANKADCIIIGGGASGLAACAYLAAHGVKVILLERLDRVGKKIMAAGNGRCNLSNVSMDASFYAEAASFVSSVYRQTPPEEVHRFFASLGLMTTQEDGRIYPRTMMAASVLDVLRNACSSAHVRILTGSQVKSLMPSRRGGWSVQLENGEGFFSPVVLCTAGGSAAPHLGTDGSGTAMLSSLGHSITPLHPALVQLRCDHPALRSLKGIRIQAALTLFADDQAEAKETGELLFADYGVSGVCVFQLSRFAAKALAAHRKIRLEINLLPEIPPQQIKAWLTDRILRMQGIPVRDLFTGVFPRLLIQAILRDADLPADAPSESLTTKQIDTLARTVTSFTLPVTGTQGMKNAQVTAGGVCLDEIDPSTMASRLFDGLYLAGEVTDVDGPCGGYNLHYAFSSGLTAAKAIAAQV